MKRRWRVAAAFFETAESRWLDDFMEGDAVEGGGRSFTKILRPHTPMSRGNGRQTGLAAWLSHLRHARAALAGSPDGVITCFPPLAMCTALLARLGRHEARIVAYNYNLGEFRGGAKRLLARLVAHRIDAFVVHAPSEVDSYAAYLGIPRNRVRFIPLQRGAIDIARREETEAPFLVAMGSAHRDYPTLIAAVDALAIPTIIVTRPADAEALPKTPYVTVRSNLSAAECLDLLARARLSVTPIANLATASGQVTILDAMATGVPVSQASPSSPPAVRAPMAISTTAGPAFSRSPSTAPACKGPSRRSGATPIAGPVWPVPRGRRQACASRTGRRRRR